MAYYFTALQSRAHAFLLERKFKSEDIECEITYMPRAILIDLCNMGIKFSDREYARAIKVIKKAGLPGCRVYKEIMFPNYCQYEEVSF